MLDQSTVDKLHAMRFPKMAEAYILQSKDPRYEAQSFEERFAALVDAEYQNRIVNRRRRLLKAAKLEQSHARLEEINYTCGRRLNRRLIEKLGTCEYIERNLNVFITGATGGGKTYLACALGYEACCHDYPTAFIRLSDYLTDIALARQENTYRKILKKYTTPSFSSSTSGCWSRRMSRNAVRLQSSSTSVDAMHPPSSVRSTTTGNGSTSSAVRTALWQNPSWTASSTMPIE